MEFDVLHFIVTYTLGVHLEHELPGTGKGGQGRAVGTGERARWLATAGRPRREQLPAAAGLEDARLTVAPYSIRSLGFK
jgi:hypothetical protein